MTLQKLIEDLRDGKRPKYEDLRSGILALDTVLSIVLGQVQLGKPVPVILDLVIGGHTLPLKDVLGDNHPDAEGYQERRRAAKAQQNKTLH